MHHRIPFLLPLLLVAAVSPAADKNEKQEPVIDLEVHPDIKIIEQIVEQGIPMEVDGDVIRLQIQGVQIQVRPMTERDRHAFFLVRSRLQMDPMPSLKDFPEGFTVFEVSFLNDSTGEFQFLPGMASLLRGRSGSGDRELFIMGLGELYPYFNRIFDGRQELVEQAMEVIYHQTLYLAPGERTTKLLIFEGLSKRTKRFLLNLDFLFIGSDTQDIQIPFLAERVER